ncbi:uncharacterized protein LOC144446730 [Glandiceps talaboti]
MYQRSPEYRRAAIMSEARDQSVSDNCSELQLMRVTSIVPALIDEEQWNWIVVDDHPDSDSDDRVRVLGAQLLRHGKTINKIHGYFRNLEARKCCMSLAGPKTSLTNIRLVRNDGRDSGIEEGAMSAPSMDPLSFTKQLGPKEFAVYQHAMLCAEFPVLGAPAPPSPYTPPPTSPLKKTFSNSLSSPISNQPSAHQDSHPDSDSDEATSPVQSETLFELVRQAFGLTPEKHQHYSDIIVEGHGRKPPPKLLVEELVSQLVVLENNRHPYYSPQSFLSRNAYDQWQQMERSHVSQLINKFWHFSLPPPQSAMSKSAYWFNRHEEYNSLLKRLLRFESTFKRSSAFFIPLSSSSRRLLKEFGLRYGVGELYRKAVYLEYLARNFENEVGLIKHITKTLDRIFHLVQSQSQQRTRLIMTRSEFDLLNQTVTLLHGQCGNSLTRIKRLFSDNQPPDGLESLICLLSSVLRLKSRISGQKGHSVEHWLKQYMQESFAIAYERHKLIATTELNLNAFTTPLSPRLLNILLFDIRDEVTNYRQYYLEVFHPYCDVVQLAAKAFYKFLMEDVKQLCDLATQEDETGEIDLMMLSLAYRLNRLDADWATFILPEDQSWRKCFLHQISKWLVVLKEHLVSLVLQSVGNDKFETLALPSELEDCPLSSSTQEYGRFGPTGIQLNPSEGSAFSSVPSSGNMTPGSPMITDKVLQDRPLREKVESISSPKSVGELTSPILTNQNNGQTQQTYQKSLSSHVTTTATIHYHDNNGDDHVTPEASPSQFSAIDSEPFTINEDYKFSATRIVPTRLPKIQTIPEGHQTSEDEQILSFASKHPKVVANTPEVNLTEKVETSSSKQDVISTAYPSSDGSHSCGYVSESADSVLSHREPVSKVNDDSSRVKVESGCETLKTTTEDDGDSDDMMDISKRTSDNDEIVDKENVVADVTENVTKEITKTDRDENVMEEQNPIRSETQVTPAVGTMTETAETVDDEGRASQRDGTMDGEGKTTASDEMVSDEDRIIPKDGIKNAEMITQREDMYEEEKSSHKDEVIEGDEKDTHRGETIDEEGGSIHGDESGENEGETIHRDETMDEERRTTMRDGTENEDGKTSQRDDPGNKDGETTQRDDPRGEEGLTTQRDKTKNEDEENSQRDDPGGVEGVTTRRDTSKNEDEENSQRDDPGGEEGVTTQRGTSKNEDGKLLQRDDPGGEEGVTTQRDTSKNEDGKLLQRDDPGGEEGVTTQRERKEEDVVTHEVQTSVVSTLDELTEAHFIKITPVICKERNLDLGDDENEELAAISANAESDESCLKSTLCPVNQDRENASASVTRYNIEHSVPTQMEEPSQPTIDTAFQPIEPNESVHSSVEVSDAITEEDEDDSEKVLPVSGSLIDIICIVKRLSSFLTTMNELLSPIHECSEVCVLNGRVSDVHRVAMETINKQKMKAGQEFYDRMLQAFSSTLCNYADNMLGMDLCAVPRKVAMQLLGRQLLQHMRWERKSNRLWGCRHMSAGIGDCYQYVSRESQYLCDSFEPVTQDMCTRINNVAGLVDLIPVFQSILSQAVPLYDNNDELPEQLDKNPPIDDFVMVGDASTIPRSVSDCFSSADSATSNSRPSSTNTTASKTDQISPTTERHSSEETHALEDESSQRGYQEKEPLRGIVFGHCELHLNYVKDSLINLLAQKMNLFFKQGLQLLIELDMEGYSIERRLQPLTVFLTNYLKALKQWLYPECYSRVHLVLWYFITEDFEEEAYKLKRFHERAESKAMLLLQALSFMIEFIHDGDQGLSIDQLIPPAEHVMQLLQLFSWSTKKLINLYQRLHNQQSEEGETFASSLQLPPRELLQTMRHDLHNIRKCFTGKQLVDWIMVNYPAKEVYTSQFHVDDQCIEVEIAMGLAQRLLDLNIICPAIDDLHPTTTQTRIRMSTGDSSPVSSPYPEISLHSRSHLSSRHRWSSSESESSTIAGRVRTSTLGTDSTLVEETEQEEVLEGHQDEEKSSNRQSDVQLVVSDIVPPAKDDENGPKGEKSRTSQSDNVHTISAEIYNEQGYLVVPNSVGETGQFTSKENVTPIDELLAGGDAARVGRIVTTARHSESTEIKDQSNEIGDGDIDKQQHKPSMELGSNTHSRSSTPATVQSGTSSTASRRLVETPILMYSSAHLYRFTDVDDEELYSYHSDTTIYSANDYPIDTNDNNECHRIKVGMQNKCMDPMFVLTVIYTRKRRDPKAKRLLKHLPKVMLTNLEGERWSFGCF